MKTYIIFDIETTGLKPEEGSEITEIGAIKIDEYGKEIERFHSLVEIEGEVSEFITNLTGLTREALIGNPKVEEVLIDFIDFVGDGTLVAHHSLFDVNFINFYIEKYELGNTYKTSLCTMKTFKLFFDGAKAKLEDCCYIFDIKLNGAHRAMADVEATKHLFIELRKVTDIFIRNHEEDPVF